MAEPIYLDYNATTPVAPEAVEALSAAAREAWGNPSSAHAYGRRAAEVLARAREQVASLVGCAPDEIVFTSGGTEADNAAIIGVAEALAGCGRHVVTSAIEHPAIEAACAYLEGRGFSVTRVGVDREGRVDPGAIARALGPETTLVSVMHSNNETGVLQPIREIASLTRPRRIVLHSDAAQSVGKVKVDVNELGCDLLTIAGHKLYAPKGVGALVLRRGTPFAGFMRGGGQESGRRAGTESTPLVAALGAACEVASRNLASGGEARLGALRDRLAAALGRELGPLVIHGARAARLPNTLSAALPGTDAGHLLERLPEVAASAGAACHAGQSTPSHVLRAMGVPAGIARSTLRLSVGRPTTEAEIDAAAAAIARAARDA